MSSAAGPKNRRRAVVSSFDELAGRPLVDGVNALCWTRSLDGDFGEVARLVAPADGIANIDEGTLRALPLSAAGRRAADVILEDMRRLDELGHDPELNCITRYQGDERGLPIRTDVMSFHVDRSPIEVDTWLCTYHGACSEGLDNDDARLLVDDPAIRAALLREYGGADDAGFADFLREGSFDLHYAAVAGARPYSFGVANLWRLATAWPGCPVLPCVHRGPRTAAGDEPRLLLIA